jgi:hypothetical protein
VLVAAFLGFLLLGIGAVGCVSFGITEIANHDSIFLNDGLGEVLTVLGVYFTVPYLFCIIAFAVVVMQPRCFSGADVKAEWIVLYSLTLVMFLVQQSITDIYLDLLLNHWVLFIAVGDIAAFAAYIFFRFETPHATVGYVLLYAMKMTVQWPEVGRTAAQSFFGPNGVNVMLFLSIPIVHFPLYVMGTGSGTTAQVIVKENSVEGRQQHNIVETFTGNFNLFLLHLLHSLDIIAMYGFSLPSETGAVYAAAPAQLNVMIIVIVCCAFLGNNLSVVHLFYRRPGVERAEIPFLPRKFLEATREAEKDDEEHGTNRRRMFQYTLFMLVVCDVPMLLTRFEVWRNNYGPLNIFVAKNIKSVVDAIMMVTRTDRSQERKERAMSRGSQPSPNRVLRATSVLDPSSVAAEL